MNQNKLEQLQVLLLEMVDTNLFRCQQWFTKRKEQCYYEVGLRDTNKLPITRMHFQCIL